MKVMKVVFLLAGTFLLVQVPGPEAEAKGRRGPSKAEIQRRKAEAQAQVVAAAETKHAAVKLDSAEKRLKNLLDKKDPNYRLSEGRGLNRWRSSFKRRAAALQHQLERTEWKRVFAANNSTVQHAGMVVGLSPRELGEAPTAVLARALLVLEVEAPKQALAFRLKLGGRGAEVDAETQAYRDLYAVPCRAPLRREGASWPPHYICEEPPAPISAEPAPLVTLKVGPKVVSPTGDADEKKVEVKKDPALERARRQKITERDKQLVTSEELSAPPTKFCVQDVCFSAYKHVATTLYGGSNSDRLPVFCAPKKGKGGAWETSRVQCSTNWLDTLDEWKPWGKGGKPGKARDRADLPPFACIGSPHVFDHHMILPKGGEAGQGFRCRKRIFQVQVKMPEKSLDDVRSNITQMCTEMRHQVWGEKYPDINVQYQKWCHGPKGPKDKSLCPKPGAPAAGVPGAPAIPYFYLSREELLFFFGGVEYFCRANRPGLVHFLYNDQWADVFTCGIARGILEGGPFEEGVQTCAIVPYGGDRAKGPGLQPDDFKARMHCWRFSRPTCEAISDPVEAEKKDSLWQSSVFDAYDTLMHARRTHNQDAWRFYDIKDSEKLADYEEVLGFGDGANDEGLFGVKKFCRFVGNLKNLHCGYTKKTMAQWYELYQAEPAEACGSGVCARGAYSRGYYCGLFTSPDYFAGEPFWGCGIDVGAAGRKILAKSRAICAGGARAKKFHSAKGDKGSLQCYERRFRWGETEQSEDILRQMNWAEAVQASGMAADPKFDPWLAGGDQGYLRVQKLHDDMEKAKSAQMDSKAKSKLANDASREGASIVQEYTTAKRQFIGNADRDEHELIQWAARYGHTLGHRASMRAGLSTANIKVIQAFRKFHFEPRTDFAYNALGQRHCQGKQCRYQFHGDPDNRKDPALKKETAAELNSLVADVVNGSRAADGAWYQSFRLVASEEGQLRIHPGELEIALRVHHLYEVLEAARRIWQQHAKKYAEAVLRAGRNGELLSRLEVHERARGSAIADDLKGNVFCVEDVVLTEKRGSQEYVCASSPMLVAGAVEARVASAAAHDPERNDARDPESLDRLYEKVRSKMKMPWCYGGTAGKLLFGSSPSQALSEPNLSSPYFLEVPPAVIQGAKLPPPGTGPKLGVSAPPKGISRYPLARLTKGDSGAVAEADALDLGLTHGLAAPAAVPKKPKVTAVRKPPAPKAKSAAPSQQAAVVKMNLSITKAQKKLASTNWLKCANFVYNDERWADADPKREPPRAKGAKAAAGPDVSKVGAGGDVKAEDRAKAEKEGKKITEKIGGFLKLLLDFVAPGFGKVLDQIVDVVHVGAEFYEKYVAKYVEIAKAAWAQAREAMAALQGKLDEARKQVKEAESKFHKTEVAAAAAQGPAKAPAEEKRLRAEADLKETQKALVEKEKALKEHAKKIGKQAEIAGTGGIVSELINDLANLATERVMKLVEPHARKLFTKGFSYVRKLLDIVAKAVLTAIGNIPFVGGVLAPIAQELYIFGMDKLEEAAGNGLLGIIERLIGKAVRALISPVVQLARKAILKMAMAACQALNPEVCPQGGELKFSALPAKDQWLERALACPGRPLFDQGELDRKAAIAQMQMHRMATEMRREAPLYARDIADQYLARYGYSYSSWMAAVGEEPRPENESRVDAIRRGLQKLGEQMKAERPAAKRTQVD